MRAVASAALLPRRDLRGGSRQRQQQQWQQQAGTDGMKLRDQAAPFLAAALMVPVTEIAQVPLPCGAEMVLP